MRKLKNYVLKSVSIKALNDWNEWKEIGGGIICEEQYSYDKYFTDVKDIFEPYTESREQYEQRATKNPNYSMEEAMADFNSKMKIEIETLSVFSEKDLKTIKRVFRLRYVDRKVKTIYNRVQQYGGAEEGGWYYHNMYLTNYSLKTFPKNYELDTDSYGEGYVMYEEYYKGENENTEKQFYC